MKSERSNSATLEDRYKLLVILKKLEYLFNFQHENFISFDAFIRLLYRPTDPASLGVIRILFGLLMMIDALFERGGLQVASRWGNEEICHFPLFPQIKPLRLSLMYIIYGILFLAAGAVMIGFKFHYAIATFCCTYWYIFLLDKSFWNNHSYLFGVTSILLLNSSANRFWSVDGLVNPHIRNQHVPYWNYFVLKFQFFLLYFYAGLKKMNREWLSGYTMVGLGHHWVFYPFRLFLTTEAIDFLVVHWFGFLLDLTIGFWMLCHKTRPTALLFCATFHLMNSALFDIGMFPYVCLATLPLFCSNSWPRSILRFLISEKDEIIKPNSCCIYPIEKAKKLKFSRQISWRHQLTAILILIHCFLQGFLPYSHFITKGFNNWTNGLYGYSWDMMVHAWDTSLVVVKVVDNTLNEEHFIDPGAWTINDRWNKHADMCIQYAQCIKNNLINGGHSETMKKDNISVYIDVWCALNGRFKQRMFDPNYDLLKAKWSPFQPIEWLLPLLTDYSGFREKLKEITEEVYSWSNTSDVIFAADFPGMHLENFIPKNYTNVTLIVLKGQIFIELEDRTTEQSIISKLTKGSAAKVPTETFIHIHTVGSSPGLFMYTFNNPSLDKRIS